MKWEMEIGTGQRRKGKKFQRWEKTWNKRRLLKVMVLLHLMTRLFSLLKKLRCFLIGQHKENGDTKETTFSFKILNIDW